MSTVEYAGATAAPRASELTRGTIVARIERLNASALQIRARILVGMATFFDGFDAIAIAAALPLLIKQWGLSSTQIGLLLAGSAIGQLIGTLVFPQIADRIGRLKAIAWSTALIGITSIALGFSPSFEVFLALRIIQGIGLGGELPVAATYINEIIRAHGRGRFVILYEVVYPIGLLVSTIAGAWIVPRFGWETMFFIGGLPLLLALVIRFIVPESPRWLAEKGRLQEANDALHRFEASARAPLPPPQNSERFDALLQNLPRRSVGDLFGSAYRRRTFTIGTLWATAGFIQGGLTTWLPAIYQNIYHAPLQTALNLAIGSSALGVIGSLVCAFTVDRFGRKPVITWSLALCALSLLMAGLLAHQSVYVVATFCSLAFGFMASGFITAFVYTPELYPTSIRALGCGTAGIWSKFGMIVAPMIITHLMIGGRVDTAFYFLAATPLITVIAIAVWGIETRGKVLEELEER